MTDYLSLERYKPSKNFLPLSSSLSPPSLHPFCHPLRLLLYRPRPSPHPMHMVRCIVSVPRGGSRQCSSSDCWSGLSITESAPLDPTRIHHRDRSTHASHRTESAPLDPTRIHHRDRSTHASHRTESAPLDPTRIHHRDRSTHASHHTESAPLDPTRILIAAHRHHATPSPLHSILSGSFPPGHNVHGTHLLLKGHKPFPDSAPLPSDMIHPTSALACTPPCLCLGRQHHQGEHTTPTPIVCPCPGSNSLAPAPACALPCLCSGMQSILPLLQHAIRPASAQVCSTISKSTPLTHW